MFFKLVDGVAIENIRGSLVLIDAIGNAAVLNSSASRMIESLLRGATLDLTIQDFVQKHDVSETNARKDMETVLDELEIKGLIERAN